MQEAAPQRETKDGIERKKGKPQADFAIAYDKERNVEGDDEYTEGYACHMGCHEGNPDDAAIDDIIGD